MDPIYLYFNLNFTIDFQWIRLNFGPILNSYLSLSFKKKKKASFTRLPKLLLELSQPLLLSVESHKLSTIIKPKNSTKSRLIAVAFIAHDCMEALFHLYYIGITFFQKPNNSSLSSFSPQLKALGEVELSISMTSCVDDNHMGSHSNFSKLILHNAQIRGPTQYIIMRN